MIRFTFTAILIILLLSGCENPKQTSEITASKKKSDIAFYDRLFNQFADTYKDIPLFSKTQTETNTLTPMLTREIIGDFFQGFTYESDSKDSWQLLVDNSGDCEDYHLTLANYLVEHDYIDRKDIKLIVGDVTDTSKSTPETFRHAWLSITLEGKEYYIDYNYLIPLETSFAKNYTLHTAWNFR
ncbi:MAG: hypothetical protein L3J43_08255 [Sulfurovum sp.]|nr:hypothetical protein [Sulfurovum sp.]